MENSQQTGISVRNKNSNQLEKFLDYAARKIRSSKLSRLFYIVLEKEVVVEVTREKDGYSSKVNHGGNTSIWKHIYSFGSIL